MEDQLISFETAKLAKEKGFDEPCCYKYGNIEYDNVLIWWGIDNGDLSTGHINSKCAGYSASTQSLLQKWLREVHNINVNPIPNFKTNWNQYHLGIVFKNNLSQVDIFVIRENDFIKNKLFESYEQALEAGLIESLKLIP